MLSDRFSTKELAKYSDLSAHMVAYLCRSGLLIPSKSIARKRGVPLRFSFQDVVLARAIRKLLAAGASITALKRALVTLRCKIAKKPTASLANLQVCIVGDAIIFPTSADELVDLAANGQLAFHFILEKLETERPRPKRQPRPKLRRSA
jgi:DNA-binding transcriptional MerR regulator